MTSSSPTILWLRRDLRLADHPGWLAALDAGGPVLPVFILDPVQERALGAAPRWRLGESLRSLSAALEAQGSRLVLRRGDALDVLRDLARETGARRVVWSRLYDPEAIARDTAIKTSLTEDGLTVTSVNAALLFEPWTVATKAGGSYGVYTPFWRAVSPRDVDGVLPAPGTLAPPEQWPRSDDLRTWAMGAAMNRGAAVVAPHAVVGEDAARDRLAAFLETHVQTYKADRDKPALPATSGLSENLAVGEISPRQIWHAARGLGARGGAPEAQIEHFLKEVVWREFAYHLIFHTPHITTRCWREEWESFGWRPDNEDAERWRRGMTGIRMIDAAMRQLYVTGTMHNRGRMLVASFLTKHLLTDWRVGAEWFRECLIDWDPASNAMGWQWTAGCGPDAAPYFRVFNPLLQAEKFDPDSTYQTRFIAEGARRPHSDALAFFDAVPRSWGLNHGQAYPAPVVDLAKGRALALEAYKNRAAA